MPADTLQRGFTVREIAQRYRIGMDKVRNLIRSGRLPALNTAATKCGRPRFIVLAEDLEQYEANEKAATKSVPRRKRATTADIFGICK